MNGYVSAGEGTWFVGGAVSRESGGEPPHSKKGGKAHRAWTVTVDISRGRSSARMRVAYFLGAFDELGEFAKMLQAIALAARILTAGGRENVDLRAVKTRFLQAVVALALGKLLVNDLAVKGHHARREFAEFLREDDAALGKILARKFLDAPGGFLDEIGEADSEFDDAAVVRIVEGLGDNARFKERRPELIAAAGVIMTGADRGLAGIAAHDHELHAFAEIVGKCLHSAFTRTGEQIPRGAARVSLWRCASRCLDSTCLWNSRHVFPRRR